MFSVKVCTGKTCTSRYSKYILARLLADKQKFDTGNLSTVEECTCRWRCQEWPAILFEKEMLTRVNPVKASEAFLKRLAELKKKHSEKS